MSGPSRKGVEGVAEVLHAVFQQAITTSDRIPPSRKEIVREFESLLPELNAFDVSKYERYERVEFDYVEGIPISALRISPIEDW